MPKIIRSLPLTAEWKVETRGEGEEKSPVVTGYAAMFNEPSSPMLGFREMVAPGAFARSLSEGADVRALWNHDDNYVMGRSASGTLRLEEDDKGLKFEIDPPDTQWMRDHMVTLKRGDVSQSSFGFSIIESDTEVHDGEEYVVLRDVELFDVSPVTYPAYPQTESEVRTFLTERGIQIVPKDEKREGIDDIIRRGLAAWLTCVEYGD